MIAWPFAPLHMFGYDFAMIDVPWPWRAYGEGGYAKSPEAQYSTMTWPEIEALPVGHLLRSGGVVWAWCTWPLIGRQAACIAGWGLTVKTGGVWAKRHPSGRLRWGTGYMLRSVCEPFLLATIGDSHGFRGRGQPNLIETVCDVVLDGIAREHSRKPDEAYRIVEELTPHAFRADVFARQRRAGWDAFGDEATKFASQPENAAP